MFFEDPEARGNTVGLRKFEIRISKFDATLRSSSLRSTRTNSNDRNSNDQNEEKLKASYHAVFVLNFVHLDFGFVSDFVLRASNLNRFLNSTEVSILKTSDGRYKNGEFLSQ